MKQGKQNEKRRDPRNDQQRKCSINLLTTCTLPMLGWNVDNVTVAFRIDRIF